MSELTADQALFLLQNVYLGSLKNESRITRKVLEAVPADKCQHRPDPVSKNAIELVRHIAVAALAARRGADAVHAVVLEQERRAPAAELALHQQIEAAVRGLERVTLVLQVLHLVQDGH